VKVGWKIGLGEALSGSCGNSGEEDIDEVSISSSVGFSNFKVGEGGEQSLDAAAEEEWAEFDAARFEISVEGKKDYLEKPQL
jgi:hypothetical protein